MTRVVVLDEVSTSLRAAAVGAVVLTFSMAAGAVAAERVGRAVSINDRVTGKVEGQTRYLREGNAVHYRERLVAGPKSTGQFVLGDNTKIALGPGAQLRLDNVVLGRSRRTARAVGLRLVQGAMRFATGFSRKRVYRINAAAATIGVRGTIFDAFTLGRLTAVILLQGELRVCLGRRNCRVLRNRCDWVVIGPDGRLARPRGRISNRRLGFPISHAFPFLHRDSRLNPGLKAGGSGCASPTGFTPLVPDSWSNRDPFLAPERSDGNGRRTDAGDDGQRDDGGSDGGSDGGGYDDGGESK